MKKLIILVSLIALLASGMVFAQVSVNGTLQFEMANDFDGDTNPAGATANGLDKWDPDSNIAFTWKVDDINSAYVRMRLNDGVITAYKGNRAVYWDKAYITTNVSKALMLEGFAWSSMIGLNEWTPAFVGNVGWDITKKIITKISATGPSYTYFYDEKIYGTKQTFGVGPANVAGFFGLYDGTLQDWFLDATFATEAGPGKLTAEVAYMNWFKSSGTKEMGDGTMLLGAAYDMKSGDMMINTGASFNLALNSEVGLSQYALASKVSMGTMYGLVGFQGILENTDYLIGGTKTKIKGQALRNVRLAAGIAPSKMFGADVGVLLYTGGEEKNLATVPDDREMLNTLDISAYVNLGKANYRLGYILVPDDDVSLDPYMTDSNVKSLYFIATLAF